MDSTRRDDYAPSIRSRSASITSEMSRAPSRSDTESSVRGLRKRTSFFGRHKSNASDTRRPSLSSIATSTLDEGMEPEQTPDPPAQPVRRRHDPLESLRKSLFGHRRRQGSNSAESMLARPASRNRSVDLHRAASDVQVFHAEDEYYRHLKKQSVSPPFNFHHVTHTTKTHLPSLETVDEKDLPGQVWSVSTYQKPTRHLTGIQAEDLNKTPPKQKRYGRASPASPRSPISPRTRDAEFPRPVFVPLPDVSPLEEAFENDENARGLARAQPVQLPKRDSLLLGAQIQGQKIHNPPNEVATTLLSVHPPWQRPGTSDSTHKEGISFYNSAASSEYEFDSTTPEVQPRPQTPTQPSNAPTHPASPPAGFTEEAITFRSQQPLPPLPPASKAARKALTASLESQPLPRNSSHPCPEEPPRFPRPCDSKASMRSRGTNKSTSPSSVEYLRPFGLFPDASWEEDVDFCYELEAESTCNFNWGSIYASHGADALACENSVTALSVSHAESPVLKFRACMTPPIYHADSPNLDGRVASPLHGPGRVRASPALTSSSSIDNFPDQRRFSAQKRGRGSSVGHRGFLAARKSSTDLAAIASSNNASTPSLLRSCQSHANLLSPVYTPLDCSEDATTATVTTITTSAMKAFAPPGGAALLGDTHLAGPLPAEYLSDPESYRHSHSDSSKHRKSSSYGSWESVRRPYAGPPPVFSTSNSNSLPNGTANGMAIPPRWSTASSSSAGYPLELVCPTQPLDYRPKSKSALSLSQSVVSPDRPLATEPSTTSPRAYVRLVDEEASRQQCCQRPLRSSSLAMRSERESLVMGSSWI